MRVDITVQSHRSRLVRSQGHSLGRTSASEHLPSARGCKGHTQPQFLTAMSTRLVSVAKVSDLTPGQMTAVEAEGTPLVLAQLDGQYYALHGTCTHYGAPLAEGHLHGHRVVCPWHHACFDLKTGAHLEAPGLDGLPTYPVQVQGDELLVELPEQITDRLTPTMASPDPHNQTHYVVVGGGAAGAYAVEGMRQGGFTGRITLISAEDEVPYDRPNCSKEYLSDEAPAEWMPLRDAGFYQQHGIELVLGQRVTQLDAAKQTIVLDNGQAMRYDQVLIATGGQARTLSIPGHEAANVHKLRSLADSRQLRDAAKQSQRAVVVGASFIGMEAAMSLRKLEVEVTVVGPETVPFERVFGQEVGTLAQQLHQRAGVRFQLGRKVTALHAEGDQVHTVELDDGTQLPTDLVVLGVGVQPATDFLQGVSKAVDGGLTTDAYLQVQPGVYAAGDLAHVPYRGQASRIEHWKVAAQQGRIAGRNMAGAQEVYQAEPFFWSVQAGTAFGYVGHARGDEEVVIDGNLDPEEPAFLAYYKQGDTVNAVLAAGRDVALARVQELFVAGKTDWESIRQT